MSSMVPLEGRTNCAMERSSVVLPQPLAPIMETNSPWLVAKVTPSSARVSVPSDLNVTPRPLQSALMGENSQISAHVACRNFHIVYKIRGCPEFLGSTIAV